MKSFFSNPTIALTLNAQKALTFAFNFLRIESVSGDVTMRLSNGDPLTARAGRVYTALPGEYWDKIDFLTTDATATVEITIGIGGSSSGGGSGSGQMSTGDGAPTAPPDDTNSAAIHYDRTGAALYNWNTTSQAWE